MFSKRPKKTFSRKAEHIPSYDLLQKTCFVTGGNSGVFDQIYECLDSLKTTTTYKTIDTFVLDLGLSEQDKVTLKNDFNVVKFLDLPQLLQEKLGNLVESNPRAQMALAGPYIDDIIKGYNFIFFSEADIWVQNEASLDNFLHLAQEQGIGCASYSGSYKPSQIRSNGVQPPFKCSFFSDEFHHETFICPGFFCLKSNSPFSELRKTKLLETLDQNGYASIAEEFIFCETFHQMGFKKLLPSQDLFYVSTMDHYYYQPLLDADGFTLLHPFAPHEPLGLIHYGVASKHHIRQLKTTDGKTIEASVRFYIQPK